MSKKHANFFCLKKFAALTTKQFAVSGRCLRFGWLVGWLVTRMVEFEITFALMRPKRQRLAAGTTVMTL